MYWISVLCFVGVFSWECTAIRKKYDIPFGGLDLTLDVLDQMRATPHTYQFEIRTTWDNRSITHDPIHITLGPVDDHNRLKLTITGPFFNDPSNPGGTPGQPFPGLWDYEVAETFFLNDHDQYLEAEFSPHGQHLLLLLKGERDSFKQQLPLSYSASIKSHKWEGTAYIPASYFPPNVTKFNAYAIHGSGDNRIYESLYPVPTGRYHNADFHKLHYFQAIDFRDLMPWNWSPLYHSEEWKPVIAFG